MHLSNKVLAHVTCLVFEQGSNISIWSTNSKGS